MHPVRLGEDVIAAVPATRPIDIRFGFGFAWKVGTMMCEVAQV